MHRNVIVFIIAILAEKTVNDNDDSLSADNLGHVTLLEPFSAIFAYNNNLIFNHTTMELFVMRLLREWLVRSRQPWNIHRELET